MTDDLVARLRGLALYDHDDVGIGEDAADEIERLRGDRDSWCDQASQRVADWDEMRKRAERAEAERDALRKDAERYRWLRDYALMVDFVADSDNRVQIWISGFGEQEVRSYGKTLDEAVDAAMKP